MSFLRRIFADVPLIALSGDVDRGSSKRLRLEVRKALRSPNPRSSLLFDLTGCSFIDGGALTVFLCALDSLPGDGWVGVIGASAAIYRLLDICGLTEIPRLHLFQSHKQARTFIEHHPMLAV